MKDLEHTDIGIAEHRKRGEEISADISAKLAAKQIEEHCKEMDRKIRRRNKQPLAP